MKTYEPNLPKMTIKELEESSYDEYRVVMEVVRHAAFLLYHSSHATYQLGLEGCMETIIAMLDQGLAKIVYREEEELLYIGYFNSATGQYQPPAFMKELEEEENWLRGEEDGLG